MSGGLDSTAAALMLKEKGYQVTGITFLFSDSAENAHNAKNAKELANLLQIEHIVADVRNSFNKHVIQYVVDEYRMGKTPFPCAVCNPQVKFHHLAAWADRLNIPCIATGHYARTKEINGKIYILEGADPEKDQSFFLWGIPQNIIKRVWFPLGELKKTAVRNYVKTKDFYPLIPENESFGICFTKEKNYRSFLQQNGINNQPGNIINKHGEFLGQHKGIYGYTIGQRKGLGTGLNTRSFVTEIRPESNEVVVGTYQELYKNAILINKYQFVHVEDLKNPLKVRIRYRLQQTPCRINITDEEYLKVDLLEPLAMIAKGQTAVFYHEDRVVGGGFITAAY